MPTPVPESVRAEACALADSIRELFAINPDRVGWFCRPVHTRRQIKLGHRRYGECPAITDQVHTLLAACERLELGRSIGYAIVTGPSGDEPPAAEPAGNGAQLALL